MSLLGDVSDLFENWQPLKSSLESGLASGHLSMCLIESSLLEYFLSTTKARFNFPGAYKKNVSENWESSEREIGPISATIDENPVLSSKTTKLQS